VKTLLIIVASDPRASRRPAEAVRIAAGVGVWKKVSIALYLRGAAALALNESTDDLQDEENFIRYLPMIGESGNAIYVQSGAPIPARTSNLSIQEINDIQLARLAAGSHYVMRF